MLNGMYVFSVTDRISYSIHHTNIKGIRWRTRESASNGKTKSLQFSSIVSTKYADDKVLVSLVVQCFRVQIQVELEVEVLIFYWCQYFQVVFTKPGIMAVAGIIFFYIWRPKQKWTQFIVVEFSIQPSMKFVS